MTSETQNQTTSSSTPLLEGVQILIDRMEAAPQDFIYATDTLQVQHTPKFYHIASKLDSILSGADEYNILSHLTAEEKTALLVAYRKMMRQHFTASVIAQLFEPKEEPESKAKQVKISTRAGAITGGFGSAVIKAEGAQIESDRSLINKQIEAQIREHARVERDREFKEFTRQHRTSS